jgi:sugar (pentulose or hexulose) kinase
VPLRRPQISWTLSLAYRSDQRTARALGALRDIIRAGITRLIADGKWRGEQRSQSPPRRRGRRTGSAERENKPRVNRIPSV